MFYFIFILFSILDACRKDKEGEETWVFCICMCVCMCVVCQGVDKFMMKIYTTS